MYYAALGSGSSGNAAVIRGGDSCVLLDCGLTIKETVRRLELIGLAASDLSAVVVTHEHGDHLAGVAPLARRFKLPVYMSHGTARRARDLKVPALNLFHAHEQLVIGDLQLQPFTVPHDAAEPCQFVASHGRHQLGVLTDLGHITPHVCEMLRDCDALVLECNHDADMLRDGPYPPALQRRVGGNWGHLENRQAAELLAQLDTPRLQHLLLAHLSEQNNSPELALAAALEAVAAEVESRIGVLTQDAPSGWIELA
jgi:phosphoribosyl 1,2-cyclic phosphodiesterase